MYSEKSSCIRAKIDVFRQSGSLWAKMVVFEKKWMCSGRWLYSGKSGCIRAKVVVFGQKWLYSGKVDVFVESGCIRAKVDVVGQNGCIRKSGCIWKK